MMRKASVLIYRCSTIAKNES